MRRILGARALACTRLKRAFATWSVDGGAGALGHELPGIALVVGLGGAGAGGPWAGGAVVHALQGNAEAFLLGGFLGRDGGGKAGNRRRKRAGKGKCDGSGLFGHQGAPLFDEGSADCFAREAV